MGKKSGEIVSCYQCVGIIYCYGCKNPALTKNEARTAAASCFSLQKGSHTETVMVLGFEKGMSRKNADKLVSRHMARWVCYRTIEATVELPPGIKKRLMKKTAVVNGPKMTVY